MIINRKINTINHQGLLFFVSQYLDYNIRCSQNLHRYTNDNICLVPLLNNYDRLIFNGVILSGFQCQSTHS